MVWWKGATKAAPRVEWKAPHSERLWVATTAPRWAASKATKKVGLTERCWAAPRAALKEVKTALRWDCYLVVWWGDSRAPHWAALRAEWMAR